MKMLVVFVFTIIVACCLAAPAQDAQILRYENENQGDNSFRFAYESSDGVSRQEEGELKNVGSEDEALVVRGSVTWTAPDGQVRNKNNFINSVIV
jgi:hypothetical protein